MDFLELSKIIKGIELIDDKIFIKSDVAKALKFFKENYSFTLLKEIIAVDNKEMGIELIYRIFSPTDEENVLISTVAENNEAESVSMIFDSATADEKEIYDLFGVNFIGNPELKRLYMPESWVGHPLKKDYEEKDERLSWND